MAAHQWSLFWNFLLLYFLAVLLKVVPYFSGWFCQHPGSNPQMGTLYSAQINTTISGARDAWKVTGGKQQHIEHLSVLGL